MKKTEKSADGTSFHSNTFHATVSDLKIILGEPQYVCNDGSDKVNFEWILENKKGNVVTVYDWKEYRRISEDELIEWHIGADNGAIAKQSLVEIGAIVKQVLVEITDAMNNEFNTADRIKK